MLTIKKIWRVDGEEDVGRWKLMECWKEGSDLLKKGSYVLKNQFEPCVCHFFFVPLRRILYHVVYEIPFFSYYIYTRILVVGVVSSPCSGGENGEGGQAFHRGD